jgi:hypothetical protein
MQIILPKWRFTQAFATFTAVAFSLLYTVLFATLFAQAHSDFKFNDFFTYEGVIKALSLPEVVLPAWVHYVAFDLFTAKWQVSVSDTSFSCICSLSVTQCGSVFAWMPVPLYNLHV